VHDKRVDAVNPALRKSSRALFSLCGVLREKRSLGMFGGMHTGCWYKAMGDQSIARYHVRNYLWIFVNAQIENPSFDSQTKETLTLKAAKFGPDGPVFLNQILPCL